MQTYISISKPVLAKEYESNGEIDPFYDVTKNKEDFINKELLDNALPIK